MDLHQAKITFIEEAREMLQNMEDLLLNSGQTGDEVENINALFRVMHTIKGSAGLFGLAHIVGFAHTAENVLDRIRSGEHRLDDKLISLLLDCRDYVSWLIDGVAEERELEPQIVAEGQLLTQRLMAYLGLPDDHVAKKDASTATTVVTAQSTTVERDASKTNSETDHWHVSLRFGKNVLQNGMEPLSFLHYLGQIGNITHVETLFDALPDAEQFDPELCYLGFEINLVTSADKKTIEDVFDFVREDSRIRIIPPRSAIEEYVRLISDLPEDARRLGEILLQCGSLTEQELEEVLILQQRERDDPKAPNTRKLGSILVEEQMVPPQVVQAALEKQRAGQAKHTQERKLVKVDAAKLDQLISMVGELVIASASASVLAERLRNPSLTEVTSTIAHLVEDVRDRALDLRMVQIGEIFSRFPRVVRDVSIELNKSIDLRISGADAELDKTMVDKLSEPLLHIVRNAIDHGIESPEVRERCGKAAHGTMELNAFHESGTIVIEISDDGCGLNRNKILQKARQNGLITAEQVLTDKEICGLIFEPGFSTAEQVTNLSGRGVGMDVVKRSIEALRGDIEIESEEGFGTRVRIRLPLTLAIIDGFRVAIEEQSFVLPLDLVVECLEARPELFSDSPGFINLRDEVLPVVRLRDLFQFRSVAPSRENVVVVQFGSTRAGLLVDRLEGELQAVIKPLGQLFRNAKGIGGSTILGTGEVSLILDVAQLVGIAAQKEKNKFAGTAQSYLNH